MEKVRKKFGLFTTIAMIIGICIGSGIFFKSDNILLFTQGSVSLGVLLFILGATSIIFGGLCISELASRTDKPGGIITYMEEFVNEKSACGMGWFQIFIYYPTIAVVVSWVVGIYTCILFGWKGTLELQLLIGLMFFTITFVTNSLSARFGGGFQNISTIGKLVPLVLIAAVGLLFGNPMKGMESTSLKELGGASWLAAIGPIAYSFDGWTISTSIAHEIKDSKKNLPRALIIAPAIILIIYVCYFLGVTSLMEPQRIMELGDSHIYVIAQNLFSRIGAKVLLVFIILAVMGTTNGIILGYIRLPYAMALRGSGMFPFASKLSVLDKKWKMPLNSSLFCYGLTLFWAIVHFVTVKYNLLENSDISEIAIVMSYLFYIVLYYKVFVLYKIGKIHSALRGVFVPIMAAIGSLFILSGGLQCRLFPYYVVFCAVVVLTSILYYDRHQKENKI